MMTVAQELLIAFDNLSDAERIEVAVAILRRLLDVEFPPLTDEDLVLNAEELFVTLDQQGDPHPS